MAGGNKGGSLKAKKRKLQQQTAERNARAAKSMRRTPPTDRGR